MRQWEAKAEAASLRQGGGANLVSQALRRFNTEMF